MAQDVKVCDGRTASASAQPQLRARAAPDAIIVLDAVPGRQT